LAGAAHDGGVNFNPYLLGRVAPSAANQILMNDVLNGIKQKDGDKSTSLIQVRRIAQAPNSVKEGWVVRNDQGNLFGYTVNFVVSPKGGTNISISRGYKVFEQMLKLKAD